MRNMICCIFNVAPHYNASIYKLMDQELGCHFYLGDRIHTPIKLMKYEDLDGFKDRLRYTPLLFNFYWQKGAIGNFFKPYNYYLLIGEPYCLSNWILLILCLFSKKKVYLWTHGWYGNESFIKKIIKKLFFGLTDHLILYGDYAKKLMIGEGFNPNKLTCIYNSMDYDNQLKVRRSLAHSTIYIERFGNNNPVLIYAGRIQKNKKLDLLIESLATLKKKNIQLNLIIIGEDVENTGITQSIISSGCENEIWLYGPCYNENKLGELFYNAEICVSPGNVGLTAVHSLMYGTPVITHDNFTNQGPEFEVVMEGVTGSFFKENNANSLTETIEVWLRTAALNRSTVRKNAYKSIDERYNPNIQIKVLKELLGQS